MECSVNVGSALRTAHAFVELVSQCLTQYNSSLTVSLVCCESQTRGLDSITRTLLYVCPCLPRVPATFCWLKCCCFSAQTGDALHDSCMRVHQSIAYGI